MKYKNWTDIPPDVRSLKIYKKLEQIEKRQYELITAIVFVVILSIITLLIWL